MNHLITNKTGHVDFLKYRRDGLHIILMSIYTAYIGSETRIAGDKNMRFLTHPIY